MRWPRNPPMCPPALAAVVLALASFAALGEELRNWFDDPFFQATSSVPQCPEPAGPRVTEAERQAQSHHRAEKGTTCWLAREEDCEKSNAYSYDRAIASEIRAALRATSSFTNTSLWITVQGRVVYVEGCVAEEAQATQIEALLRRLPHVQQAIAIVTSAPGAKAPYRLIGPR